MFGFFIGTACLLGLVATVRRGFHGRHAHGGCGSAYGGCGRASGGCGSAHGCGSAQGFGSAYGGCHPGAGRGYGGPPGIGRFRRGFRGFGPRAMLSALSARLDLTPAQEKVLFQSFSEVADAVRKQRGEASETRNDLARAFRAASFDAVLLGDTFGRHDGKLDEVRKALVGALSKLHEALDEAQRERLARLLEGGLDLREEGWW